MSVELSLEDAFSELMDQDGIPGIDGHCDDDTYSEPPVMLMTVMMTAILAFAVPVSVSQTKKKKLLGLCISR